MYTYSKQLGFTPSADPETDFLRYDALEDEQEEQEPEINQVHIPDEMPWWHRTTLDDYPHEPAENYFSRKRDFENYGDNALTEAWIKNTFLRCFITMWDDWDEDRVAYYVGDSTFVEIVKKQAYGDAPIKYTFVEHDPLAWMPLPWCRKELA